MQLADLVRAAIPLDRTFFANSQRDWSCLGINVEVDERSPTRGGDCVAMVDRLQPTPDHTSITGRTIAPKFGSGKRFVVN